MQRQTPMLFSPAMIEALLAGRKTETRRGLNPQPDPSLPIGGTTFIEGDEETPLGRWVWRNGYDGSVIGDHLGCRNLPGDLIWVKEAHYAYGYWRTIPGVFTKKTGKPKREFVRDAGQGVTKGELASKKAIKVRPNNLEVLPGNLNMRPGWYARPSMFMFKADSRLTLRVTGFNIERLHDISEAAAIAEGIEEVSAQWPPNEADGFEGATYPSYADYGPNANGCYSGYGAARLSYMKLWNSINGPDAWVLNPWVECTKFEVIKRNVAEVAQ